MPAEEDYDIPPKVITTIPYSCAITISMKRKGLAELKIIKNWSNALRSIIIKMISQPSLGPETMPGWALILAPLLALTISCGAAAAAESAPPPEEQQPSGVTTGFLDEYHTYMLDKIRGQTFWFDNFFGDRRAEEDDQPSSFVRLRTVARYTEGEGMTFPIRLRANLELPRVNRRLRLVIFGGNREEDRWQEPGDSIDSSLKSAEEKEWTNLGLRYMIYKTLRDRFHFGGGLSVRWPLEYYGRMRYERLLHIGSNNVIRLSETGFWNSLNGFGETSRFDLEKRLNDGLNGRLSLFATYSEDTSGMQWGAETNLFRQLSGHSALAFDLGVYGPTEPSMRVGTYRIASRYRRNFLRPWLFFEIEPEVLFPLLESGKRETVGALTTVLEIQFVT